MKSMEALVRIVDGVKKFQAEVYPAQREMFESLKSRQQPIAMFITCADSRVVPNRPLTSIIHEVILSGAPAKNFRSAAFADRAGTQSKDLRSFPAA